MAKLGIAVIGVGALGRRHAENLRRGIPTVQLMAVADADGTRAKQVASELEVQQHFANVEDLLDRKDIQAVAVPSRFHASITRAAAAAGKHVFCEKPPALLMEEAESAMDAVAKAGVQFQIGFMRRYDAPYARAKKLIEAVSLVSQFCLSPSDATASRHLGAFSKEELMGHCSWTPRFTNLI